MLCMGVEASAQKGEFPCKGAIAIAVISLLKPDKNEIHYPNEPNIITRTPKISKLNRKG